MIKRAFRGIVQLLGGLGAGLAIMLMVAAWQLSSGPISLGFLSPYIEKAVNSGQRTFKLSMDDTILTWAGWDRTLDFRVLGVKVLRLDGVLIGSVPEVSFSLSGRALVGGLLAPQSIELFGPRLRISRGQGGIGIDFTDTDAQSRDLSQRLLNQLLAEPDPDNPMSYLTRLEIINAEITLDDQVLGKSWVTQSVNVRLRRDAVGLVGNVRLALDINGRRTEISTAVGYQSAARRIDLTVQFSDVSPAVFSSMYYELGPLRAFALPVKGTISAGMSLDGTFEAASFDLSGGVGEIIIPGELAQSLSVEKVVLKGRYEGAEGILDVDELFLDLGPKGSVMLPSPINHQMPMASLRVKGRYLGNTQRLEINKMDIDLQGPSATLSVVANGFSGIANLRRDNISVDLKGTLRDVPIDQLARYWPSALNADVHRWSTGHLSDGMIHKARAEVNLWMDGKGLEVVSVDGDLEASGVSVDYLAPMPPVREATAYLKFDKENFNIFISGGKSESLNVSKATVLISGLDEYDQIANITVAIDGAFPDMLAYLDHKPLEYASAIGIDPKTTKGSAETELKLKFIVEKALTLDDIEVSSRSRVTEVTAAKAVLGRDINGGVIKIAVDKKGMDLTGSVNIGNIPAVLSWRENFGKKIPFKRRYNVKVHIADTTQITELGLDVARFADKYIRGGMAAEIDYTIFDDVDRRLQIKADISNAELSAPAFGWSKIPSVPGKASITIDFEGDIISDVPAFSIDAGDLKIKGKARYAKGSGKLNRIDFEQIIYGRTDIKGALIARKEGGWDIGFHGASFELTPIWNDIFSKQAEYGSPETLKLPFLTMAVELERVWVGPAKFLDNISGTFVHRDDLWNTVLLKGEIGAGKSFELTIRPGDAGNRVFIMTSADAGEALRVMDFYDEMRGGKLEITGKYNDMVPSHPLIGKMIVTDYQITDAPVLTRVLSVMSLTGILDELEGGGLKFSNLEIPFVQSPGLLEVKEANASGTSIGFTGSGTIYTYADVMDISGTVVPVYVLNSALGHIPLLGEIFTGGAKGSGVFAVNYSMNGPTDEPNVTINPLSALTPGIFRNVFDIFGQAENKSDPQPQGGIQ